MYRSGYLTERRFLPPRRDARAPRLLRFLSTINDWGSLPCLRGGGAVLRWVFIPGARSAPGLACEAGNAKPTG